MKAVVKWTLIILVGLFIIGLIFGDKQDPNSSGQDQAADTSSPQPDVVIEVTADQLFNAYEENEVATDEKIGGNPVLITGIVQAIDKDFTDAIVLELKTSNQFMPARLKIDDADKALAINLRKGNKVAVRCESMKRIVGAPYGDDCRIRQ